MWNDAFLPRLPVDLILDAYRTAPGDELGSGKLLSPESSAALAANTFGVFLSRPADLPPLPGGEECGWPASSVRFEAIVRFPWCGGRHPCLDVLVETSTALIGIESKRYEPFRHKAETELSDAYRRPVWGDAMARYERVRDDLRDGDARYSRLDAGQLVKHAFGLRTAVHREGGLPERRPVLFYVYAEPERWLGGKGKPVSQADIHAHRVEIARFASSVEGDEVVFRACSYRDLLTVWRASPKDDIRSHAVAVSERFDI